MIEKVKITDVFSNPTNPRTIKEAEFKKLVNSIKDFPEMLNLRPIVVNAEGGIIGGNMRYQACKEIGLKEIPVIRAENLTEEQIEQFIIKDNVSFGEWLMNPTFASLLSDASEALSNSLSLLLNKSSMTSGGSPKSTRAKPDEHTHR